MLRKVVKLGGSYYIALPKNWVKAAGVKPGDYLEVRMRDTYALEILLTSKPPPSPRVYRVEENPWLEKSLMTAYLKGYEIVELRIKTDRRRVVERVEKLQRLLIGLEIIEEREDRLIIQCFTRPGYNLKSLIARMDAISREMYVDAAKSLVNGDSEFAERVISMDDRLDRLYFLTVREVRTRLLNPQTSGVERLRLMDMRLLSRELEEIGDLSEAIARRTLESGKASPDFYENALSLSSLQEKLVRAMLKGRLEEYFIVLKLDQIISSLSERKPEPHILLLKNIGEKIRDIADLAPY